jgi:hypothetical protein
MEDLRTIYLCLQGAVIVTILTVLCLQVGAYRRHRHYSFLVLAVCSLLNLAYIVLAAAPLLVPSLAPSVHALYAASMCVVAIQLPLGVWGVAALFRSYRVLSEERRTPA